MDHSQSAVLYELDEHRSRDRLDVEITFPMNIDKGDTQMLDHAFVGLEPGEQVARHVHRYSGETFYAVEGKGEIIVEGEPYPCHADEHIVFLPPGTPHYPRNPEDADERFRVMGVHVPALLNGDTYLVDEDGNKLDNQSE